MRLAKRALKPLLVVALLALSVLLPAWWTQSHALLPGLIGCKMIRERAALERCVAKVMTKRLEKGNPLTELARLDRELANRKTECHRAGHIAGERWFKSHRGSIRSVYSRSRGRPNGQCTYGFLHSILAESVELDPSEFSTIADQFCAGKAADLPGEANCYHGLGHGLIQGKLSRQKAERRCDELGSPGAVRCLEGVYMELTFGFDESKAPEALCAQVKSHGRFPCYLYVPSIVEDRGGDRGPAPLLEYCDKHIPAGPPLWACVTGSSNFVGFDRLKECRRVGDALGREVCARVAVSSGRSAEIDRRAPAVCAQLTDMAFGCFAGYGARLAAGRTKITNIRAAVHKCGELSDRRAADYCRSGALACWPVEIPRVGGMQRCDRDWFPARYRAVRDFPVSG